MFSMSHQIVYINVDKHVMHTQTTLAAAYVDLNDDVETRRL